MRDSFWRMGWTVAIGLTCLGQAETGIGDTFYVNNRTGNDANTGRAASFETLGGGPKRTVRAAFRHALPGDRIVMLPTEEPYRDQIALSGVHTRGLRERPIVLEGNGATLDGTNVVAPEWWRPLGEGRYVLHGFSTGPRAVFVEGTRIPLARGGSATTLPHLDPGAASFWRGTILLRTSNDAAPGDRVTMSQRRCGVFIDRAEHVVVRNLRIQGYWIDGAQVRGPVKGVRFESCQFTGNGRAGIALANNAAVELERCTFADNARAGILVIDYSRASLTDSSIEDGAAVTDSTSGIESRVTSAPESAPAPADPLRDRQ